MSCSNCFSRAMGYSISNRFEVDVLVLKWTTFYNTTTIILDILVILKCFSLSSTGQRKQKIKILCSIYIYINTTYIFCIFMYVFVKSNFEHRSSVKTETPLISDKTDDEGGTPGHVLFREDVMCKRHVAWASECKPVVLRVLFLQGLSIFYRKFFRRKFCSEKSKGKL